MRQGWRQWKSIIWVEGKWSSDAFVVDVRATMDYPRWVSDVLAGESMNSRKPG